MKVGDVVKLHESVTGENPSVHDRIGIVTGMHINEAGSYSFVAANEYDVLWDTGELEHYMPGWLQVLDLDECNIRRHKNEEG